MITIGTIVDSPIEASKIKLERQLFLSSKTWSLQVEILKLKSLMKALDKKT